MIAMTLQLVGVVRERPVWLTVFGLFVNGRF